MKKLFTLSFLFLISLISFGVTKTFTGTGNFSDATKWNGGTLPLAGDDLRINGTCTFDNAANNLAYLTLNVGSSVAGTLNWPVGGANTLNVTAVSSSIAGSAINMANGGTLQIRTSWNTTNQTFTPGTGTINWNVTTANSTLPASIPTYNNLTITAGSVIVTLGVATTVNNNVIISTGTFRFAGINFTCSGTVFISGTLNDNSIGGTNTLKNLTINSGGAIDNSVNETYAISGNFTMLGGNIIGTATPNYNVAGNLLILAGANNMGRSQVTVNGTTSVSATFIANSTTGKKTLNNFIVTSTGNFSCTVSENWIINGNIQFDGNANPGLGKYTLKGLSKTISGTSAVIFDDITCNGSYTNNLNITVTTSLKGAGTWTQGPTGILKLSILDANFSVITFNASAIGNTVNYSLAGAQNVRVPSDGSYGHLTASGSGVKSLLANTIANGNVTITSTLSVSASNFNLSVGGNWTNTGGAFTPGTATVTFSSTTAQSIFKSGGETFNNITFTGAGVKTFSSAITSNSNVVINAGASVDVGSGSNQLTIKKNYTNNGAINTQSGTILFNGTSAQTIGGTTVTDFYNLTINNTTGVSLTSPQRLVSTLTLSNGVFSLVGQAFTMLSTAGNTARIAQITGTGNISGNVTVQRFAPGGTTGWALIGTPMSSALTLNDWDDNIFISCPTCPDGSASGFLSIYTYDETKPGLNDDPASYIPLSTINDPIIPNKGYWVYLGTGSLSTTNITLDVRGSVRKFNNTIALSKTANSTVAEDGWNLIHNPYPSAISWTALRNANANVDNAIYVFNADLNGGSGAHATYINNISSPAVGSGGIGDNIPMWQGFYVHASAATNLTAQESNKVTGNPTFLKMDPNFVGPASSTPLVRLTLTNSSGFEDETVLYYQTGATDLFDADYDAYKMSGQDPKAPTIALQKANVFQVNGVNPVSGNFSMPLRTLTGYTGTYTITANNISSFPAGACVNLYDRFTGTTTDLKVSNYVFTLADTTSVARFDVNITSNPLNINSTTNQPNCAQPNSGEITAIGTNAGPWNYTWRDSSGIIIKTSLAKPNADTLNNLNGSTYYVEVNTVSSCDNNTTTFVLNPIIVPVASFTSDDSTDLNWGGAVNFVNTSTNSSNDYWDFGDGVGFSNATSPNYNYSAIGTYTAVLISTSSTGCNDTITKNILVTNNTAIGIQTYNNSNPLLVHTLNDNEYLISQKLDAETDLNFKLTDLTGKLVIDYGNSNSNKINLSVNLKGYDKGVYFLTITANQKLITIKLPVQ